eukprot:8477589-Alexandrium_andersonii.AAC.1
MLQCSRNFRICQQQRALTASEIAKPRNRQRQSAIPQSPRSLAMAREPQLIGALGPKLELGPPTFRVLETRFGASL